jgi:hypothetical protein
MRKPFLINDFATASFLISLYIRNIFFPFLSVLKMDPGVQDAPVQVAGQGLLRDGAGGARHRSVRRLHHRRPDTPGTTTEAAG